MWPIPYIGNGAITFSEGKSNIKVSVVLQRFLKITYRTFSLLVSMSFKAFPDIVMDDL